MRFYYLSIISILLLLLIWSIGTWLLVRFGAQLKESHTRVWPLMLPLFLLLYLGPIAEELYIAWNFDRLCKKDAGIFVYKTVQVDGFYDDTHAWRADKLEKSGFRWVEGRDRTTFKEVYWRHEWVGDKIRSYEIERPTARYHYKMVASHKPVAHQIDQFEDVVEDTHDDQVIGRYMNYRRGAPWFFIGLGRPTIPCEETQKDTRKYGRLIYRVVLEPSK